MRKALRRIGFLRISQLRKSGTLEAVRRLAVSILQLSEEESAGRLIRLREAGYLLVRGRGDHILLVNKNSYDFGRINGRNLSRDYKRLGYLAKNWTLLSGTRAG